MTLTPEQIEAALGDAPVVRHFTIDQIDELAELAADALRKVEVLERALEYIMDGYGLDGPDYNPNPDECNEDWITEKIRAALTAFKEPQP